jgi:hypothetical protein
MDVRFNLLSQQVFNKPLDDCSEQEIKSFVEAHPYFSPAQFLLLKKLNKNSEAYQKQYQKAILYYHDPFGFDFLVNAENYNIDIEERGAGDTDQLSKNIEQGTSNIEQGSGNIEQGTRNIEQGTRNIEQRTGNIEHDYHVKIKEEKSNLISSLSNIDDEQETPPPELVSTGNDEQVYQDNIHKGTKALQTFAENTHAPIKELTFEPFHTVDYFASVGIKLSQEEVTKDRMGMQLKSFTEWLKTMKRLPVPELEKKLGGDNEQKVENMAAHSVQNADVFTEAMAEVWIKQGNVSKAIEVYNNLCLQNPSKRAYFAAKIDHLKEQT